MTTKTVKQRMHTVTFKEKDKDGKFLYLNVDMVMPTWIFGESHPMLMCITDDKAFFIPYENMNWFEQNYGVSEDKKLAESLATEMKKQSKKHVPDVSVG